MNEPLTRESLQRRLAKAGAYHGALDGEVGPLTTVALMAAFNKRPQRVLLLPEDWKSAAADAGLTVKQAQALLPETGAAGFYQFRVAIEFDPRAFVRLTSQRFDPPFRVGTARPLDGQEAQWLMLAEACETDPQAAFMATRWGKFRTPGECFADAGFSDPMSFAVHIAKSPVNQLAVALSLKA